jgi:hypothetical protein
MEHCDYFPSRVYRDERPDLIEYVLPISEWYIDKCRNNNLLFSKSDNMRNECNARQLCDYLLLSTNNILRDQGYMVEKYDFYISSLCAQELKGGGETDRLFYKNSQLCGYFFLEVPEPSPRVIYYDARTNKNMIELDFIQEEDISLATNSIHFANIKPGTVLLSNSWMEHHLINDASNSVTKCLNFTISHRDILCNMY